MKRKPPAEKAIQKAILAYLNSVPGVYAFKTGAGLFPMTYKGKTRMVRMGTVGVSDIVGWRQEGGCPVFLACEVKRPGRRPSDIQEQFLVRVNRAGGIGFVATSVAEARAVIHATSA